MIENPPNLNQILLTTAEKSKSPEIPGHSHRLKLLQSLEKLDFLSIEAACAQSKLSIPIAKILPRVGHLPDITVPGSLGKIKEIAQKHFDFNYYRLISLFLEKSSGNEEINLSEKALYIRNLMYQNKAFKNRIIDQFKLNAKEDSPIDSNTYLTLACAMMYTSRPNYKRISVSIKNFVVNGVDKFERLAIKNGKCDHLGSEVEICIDPILSQMYINKFYPNLIQSGVDSVGKSFIELFLLMFIQSQGLESFRIASPYDKAIPFYTSFHTLPNGSPLFNNKSHWIITRDLALDYFQRKYPKTS